MTDREIVINYRELVLGVSCLQYCIDWNKRHGLPVLTMPQQIRDLKDKLLRFETILEQIPDRRTCNVLRCRYAVGMSRNETGDFMGLSCETVTTICNDALRNMS